MLEILYISQGLFLWLYHSQQRCLSGRFFLTASKRYQIIHKPIQFICKHILFTIWFTILEISILYYKLPIHPSPSLLLGNKQPQTQGLETTIHLFRILLRLRWALLLFYAVPAEILGSHLRKRKILLPTHLTLRS